jgi:hypothetical protein
LGLFVFSPRPGDDEPQGPQLRSSGVERGVLGTRSLHGLNGLRRERLRADQGLTGLEPPGEQRFGIGHAWKLELPDEPGDEFFAPHA